MTTVELTPALILRAYGCGLFPMAEGKAERDVFWVDPETRGVIPLDRFHVPRRLARTVRAGHFRITVDRDFPRVVRGCARRTRRRPESWINGPIFEAYCALHRQGARPQRGGLARRRAGRRPSTAWCWAPPSSARACSAPSGMPARSRSCTWSRALRAGGFTLLDTQFVTAHLSRFGAVEMSRARYLSQLADALPRPATFYPSGFSDAAVSSAAAASVQASTQMS